MLLRAALPTGGPRFSLPHPHPHRCASTFEVHCTCAPVPGNMVGGPSALHCGMLAQSHSSSMDLDLLSMCSHASSDDLGLSPRPCSQASAVTGSPFFPALGRPATSHYGTVCSMGSFPHSKGTTWTCGETLVCPLAQEEEDLEWIPC